MDEAMQRLGAKSRRMTAHGANPKRENARVAAAMRGGADSPSWRGDRRERCNRGQGSRWLDYWAARGTVQPYRRKALGGVGARSAACRRAAASTMRSLPSSLQGQRFKS